MSQQPETELDLELQLLPAWAKQSADTNRFANYRGDEEARGGSLHQHARARDFAGGADKRQVREGWPLLLMHGWLPGLLWV